MQYFDIVRTNDFDDRLAHRLGYKKIYKVGQEIELSNTLNISRKKPAIIMSSNPGVLLKALRESKVIGVILGENEPIGKVIMVAKELEKPLIIPLDGMKTAHSSRQKSIYRIRKLLAVLSKARADAVFITLAKDKHSMISAGQLIQLARFLGAKEERSKEMASKIGELHAD